MKNDFVAWRIQQMIAGVLGELYVNNMLNLTVLLYYICVALPYSAANTI